jgi:hypothetical protein
MVVEEAHMYYELPKATWISEKCDGKPLVTLNYKEASSSQEACE